MPFKRDETFAVEVGSAFGEYLTTFISEPGGQVRADLFRNGKRVDAHISFPTGATAVTVADPYVVALREYARREGVADQFHMIMS